MNTLDIISSVARVSSLPISVIIEPYIDELIEYIDYKANRVKWGIARAAGS